MISKIKTVMILFIMFITLSLVGCNCSKQENNYEIMQSGISNSVESFKSAKIEMILTSGETLLYSKVMNITKTDNGSSYNSKIKELADDLYASSLYQEREINGSFSRDETLSLFPSSEQFKEDKISNLTNSDSKMEFVVSKENLISVFDLKSQDINKISDDGVKVIFIFENDQVKTYEYAYETNDDIKVKINGTFTY